jgi:hypothetical protein
MNNSDALPDLYAILEVHPKAEPEIIKAAYRRLMKKYHPDALSPELRSDPNILSRVRSINVAYDVLSDPVQRAAYDAAVEQQTNPPITLINQDIETRVILARCGRTRQRFRILLGRRRGRERFFRVLGFELVDIPRPLLKESPQMLKLPAPLQSPNLLRRIIKRAGSNTNGPSMPINETPRFTSKENIYHIHDDSDDVNFTEINFGVSRCPVCKGVHQRSDGTSSGWYRCGRCKRIYCAGAAHLTKLGDFTLCPWCWIIGRLPKKRFKLGEDVDLPVRGEGDRSTKTRAQPQNPELKEGPPKSLPEK